jgi:hypothetical protein
VFFNLNFGIFKMKKSIAKNTLIGIVALASADLASQSSTEGNWYLGGPYFRLSLISKTLTMTTPVAKFLSDTNIINMSQ